LASRKMWKTVSPAPITGLRRANDRIGGM
jgi:hypothetical protein